MKVVRKRKISWINTHLYQHIQRRNKLLRNLRTNCKQWLETIREITRLTEKFKRATWHSHLDRISKSKDAKQAWSSERFLPGSESHTTGKLLLYNGRAYASDRAKTSAFDQEYAKISGRKSDKDTRSYGSLMT